MLCFDLLICSLKFTPIAAKNMLKPVLLTTASRLITLSYNNRIHKSQRQVLIKDGLQFFDNKLKW